MNHSSGQGFYVKCNLPLDVIEELDQAKGLLDPVDPTRGGGGGGGGGLNIWLIEQKLRKELCILAALAHVSDLDIDMGRRRIGKEVLTYRWSAWRCLVLQ